MTEFVTFFFIFFQNCPTVDRILPDCSTNWGATAPPRPPARYAHAVEDPIPESSLPVEDINENNNDPKPTTSHKTRQNHDVRNVNKEKKRNLQPLTQQGIEETLVIGDSMVKNIDEKKIERAARGKSICHSYSGATVPQLRQKFQENCDEEKYKAIILHIGTNDLVRQDADNVVKKMDVLIEEVKSRVERVAVSSVIERHDGRVPCRHCMNGKCFSLVPLFQSSFHQYSSPWSLQ